MVLPRLPLHPPFFSLPSNLSPCLSPFSPPSLSIVGKGAEKLIQDEAPRRGRTKGQFEYRRPSRGDSLNRASHTDVYPYGLRHSPPNEEEQRRREMARHIEQVKAGKGSLNVSASSIQFTPHGAAPPRTRAVGTGAIVKAQASASKRLAHKAPPPKGRRPTKTTASAAMNRNVGYPSHRGEGAGDAPGLGSVVDETYERFRYSVDMLRKNIVHGTVASISTGGAGGAVGSAVRGADLVNVSAVTQATAFATADPERSYAAASVPVGNGRKKRRTLAAKRGADKVSYLMSKSTESYAARTVNTLQEVSVADAEAQEEAVLDAALAGKKARGPAEWEQWGMMGGQRRLLGESDSAAMALMNQEMALEVAAAAESIMVRQIADNAAADAAAEAEAEREAVAAQAAAGAAARESMHMTPSDRDQSYPMREELYSSGGSGSGPGTGSGTRSGSRSESRSGSRSESRSGLASPSATRRSDSSDASDGGQTTRPVSSSSSFTARSSFMRERISPIVDTEDRALEALRQKFAHVDIHEGYDSTSTPDSTGGSMGEGARQGTERYHTGTRGPSPLRSGSAGIAAAGGGGAGTGGGTRRARVPTQQQQFDDSDDDNVEDVYPEGEGRDEEEHDEEEGYVSSDDEDSLDAAVGTPAAAARGAQQPSLLDSYMKQVYGAEKKVRRR